MLVADKLESLDDRSGTSRRPVRPMRRRTPEEVHGLAGAQVCGEQLPALAQMAPGQPQDLLHRGLPLGDRARSLGGGLAVDLALQPQERCGIPESYLGLAV
jgi:hypothetical protein